MAPFCLSLKYNENEQGKRNLLQIGRLVKGWNSERNDISQ